MDPAAALRAEHEQRGRACRHVLLQGMHDASRQAPPGDAGGKKSLPQSLRGPILGRVETASRLDDRLDLTGEVGHLGYVYDLEIGPEQAGEGPCDFKGGLSRVREVDGGDDAIHLRAIGTRDQQGAGPGPKKMVRCPASEPRAWSAALVPSKNEQVRPDLFREGGKRVPGATQPHGQKPGLFRSVELFVQTRIGLLSDSVHQEAVGPVDIQTQLDGYHVSQRVVGSSHQMNRSACGTSQTPAENRRVAGGLGSIQTHDDGSRDHPLSPSYGPGGRGVAEHGHIAGSPRTSNA